MRRYLPLLVALLLGIGVGLGAGGLSRRFQPPLQSPVEPRIIGWIDIRPELKESLKPSDSLFVIVHQPGQRLPLAVKKFFPVSFPFLYSVGPEDQMLPGKSWEGSVTVTVRLDKDGLANEPQPGDLIGQPRGGPFATPARDIHVLIDRVVEEEPVVQ